MNVQSTTAFAGTHYAIAPPLTCPVGWFYLANTQKYALDGLIETPADRG